jgi:apolipoprotein N-acyltransferase
MGENSVYEKGEEVIQTADTPYGRIGVTICKDMNFPSYIRQAGEKDVDIMLGPSYDFPKSEGPSYTARAIENGFSFIRPVYNGVSFAEDYNGNILNEMDSEETDTGIMYTDVPVEGVDTIYTTIGDSFAWSCILGSIGYGVFAIRRIKST